MPKTLVVCSECGHKFPSPIAFGSKQAFESSSLSENVTNCPECGAVVPCNKENMIFEE